MIRKAKVHSDLHRVNTYRQAPPRSHLFFFFIDDSVMFSRALIMESEKLKDILLFYEKISR